MKMPSVSIVVPVYNVELYIEQCLDSLVNQTLKNIEIIVVNDCSPAGEDSIVRTYVQKDKRIKYIKLDKNVGLGEARNIGFSHATGEYFGCVDSDDYVDVMMFEKMYEKAKKLDADICIVGITALDCSKNNSVSYMTFSDKMKSQFKETAFSYKDIEYSFFDCQVSAWSRIYKKEFHEKYIHYPVGVKHEDVLPHMIGIINAQRCCIVPDALYFYRQNRSGSLTSSVKFEDILLFLKQLKPLFMKRTEYDFYRLRLIAFYGQVYSWYMPTKELYDNIRQMIAVEKLSQKDIHWLNKKYPFTLKMLQYDFESYMSIRKKMFLLEKLCPIAYMRKKIRKKYK